MRPSRPRPAARRSRWSRSRSSATTTRICRRAKSGEIGIRTAANIKCYWRDAEATAGAVHRRWLRPHRRRRLSRRGRLSVHRRPQEGHHHPRRREHLRGRGRGGLLRLPGDRRSLGVRRARRAPWRSPDRDHPLDRTARRSSEHDLRAFLDGRLARFKIPERVIFSAEPLPRLGTGKFDRRALKAQYRALKLDRRTLLIGGGVGVGLIVGFALWPRRLSSDLAIAARRAGVRQFHQDRARRARHRRRAAGRDRAGRLDRASADRRRRARRGVGHDRGRAGAARAGSTPIRCEDAGLAEGTHADHRRLDLGPRVRAAVARSRGGRAGDAGRRRRRPLERRARDECETADGFVINGARTFTFGELAEEAADRTPAAQPAASPIRPSRGWSASRCGGSMRPAKTDGSLRFAGDVRLARTCCSPRSRLAPPGGRLRSFSREADRRRSGRPPHRRARRLVCGRRGQLVGGRARR